MNKEETYNEIKKIIRNYEKMVSNCSEQWDILNEQRVEDADRADILGEEMSSLITEIDLINGFIEDLRRLME